VQEGADAWCYDPKIGRQFAKLSIRYSDAIAPEGWFFLDEHIFNRATIADLVKAGHRRVAAVSVHAVRWRTRTTGKAGTEVSKMSDLDVDQQNAEKSKRGKRARNKGNAFEREVAARLGGVRVGRYGGKTDVQSDWIVAQCKVGNGSYFGALRRLAAFGGGQRQSMAALGGRRRTWTRYAPPHDDRDGFRLLCDLLGVKRAEG